MNTIELSYAAGRNIASKSKDWSAGNELFVCSSLDKYLTKDGLINIEFVPPFNNIFLTFDSPESLTKFQMQHL